jgi:hypothetical protein
LYLLHLAAPPAIKPLQAKRHSTNSSSRHGGEDPRVFTHAATGDDSAIDVYGEAVVGSFDHHATQVCIFFQFVLFFLVGLHEIVSP